MTDRKAGKLFRGDQGSCVFKRPLIILDEHDKKETLPVFIQRLQGTVDHRSLALLGALVLEHHLDSMLSAFMPKYKKLTDKSDSFTLSLKIAMLSALHLIPEHLTGCADVVKDVRNAFAHKLELDSFENLDGTIRDRIKTRCIEIHGTSYVKSKLTTASEQYWEVLFFAVSGLCLYLSNVITLRSRLDNPEFIKELESTAQHQSTEAMAEIMKAKPISTRFENGLQIDTYERKIVHVGPVKPDEP